MMIDKIGFPGLPFAGITPVSTVRNTYELVRNFDGTKSLVANGKEDIAAIVESSRVSALDAILDRYLDPDQSITLEDELQLRQSMHTSFTGGEPVATKLDILCDYYDMMEDTRDALGLDPAMSYAEISAYLDKNYKKMVKELEVNEKIQKTAQKDAPNSQSQNVPPNSTTETD